MSTELLWNLKVPSGEEIKMGLTWFPCVASLVRWLTQKGVRQKKLNEWLGIKNENTEE